MFVKSGREIATPPTRLLAPIAGFVLLISVLLPWVSFWGLSVSGISGSGLIGAVGILGGLAAMAAASLAGGKLRGAVHLVVGIAALVVFLIDFLPDWIEGLPAAMGVYVYLVAAGGVILGGVIDLGTKTRSIPPTEQ